MLKLPYKSNKINPPPGYGKIRSRPEKIIFNLLVHIPLIHITLPLQFNQALTNLLKPTSQ